jgi:hypothetical protein
VKPRHAILIAAGGLFVVANWVPLGREVLYPLTLFTTWVHEMGHGIAALILGGTFDKLEIFANGSGLAQAQAGWGWHMAVVALGGLLAPPIVGAGLLAFVHGPRRARIVLGALALGLVMSLVLYVRSTAGLLAMPIVAILLGYSAWRASYRVVIAQVLGMVLALDTVTRMVSYVFKDYVELGGQMLPSDIHSVAEGFGGHYALWGIAVTVFALGLLALALWWAWRREPRAAS